MTASVLVFVVAGALLVLAGSALTRAADAIAEHSGLGRVWIGAVLLAAATSLPELATDVSAVRLGAPDLGAGDLFGSSLANMLILAGIGLLPPIGRVFRAAAPAHAMTACLAITLNAAAGAFVFLRAPRSGWPVGPEAVLLAVGFVAGMRVVYAQGSAGGAGTAEIVQSAPGRSRRLLGSAVLRFGLATLAVLVIAPALAWSAKRIAELSGLGATFIGTWLVGLSTSLPEVVTSVAAVRLGAVDLAIGNLFGSNAFNMAVFLAMDVAHPEGSIFGALGPGHVLSALLAIVLMAVGLAAIILRTEGRWRLLEPGGLLMVLIYLGGLWAMYAGVAGAAPPPP